MHQLHLTSLLFATFLRITASADWCYQSQDTCPNPCQGPEKWVEVAKACGGNSQSPINIVTKRVLFDGRLTPLTFTGYKVAFDSNITNNGHSVQVDLPATAMVNGGDLEDTYKAVQIHLHWGKDGGPGSEHTIDGEQYPMEMHIVHLKQKYNSLGAAEGDPSGVAVLGFFYQESGSSNRKYESIIKSLTNIIHPSNSTTLRGVSLDMLIPSQDMTSYFRYNGSLTTPNCTEAVVWTVFENTIPLSKQQLSAFSGLKFANGSPMVGTYRPVLPLNGRQVYRSGSNAVVVSVVLFISSIITAYGL